MNMKHEIQIFNIFRLLNGQTVFGVRIFNHPELIKACRYELRLEDEVRQIINLSGEQILKKTDPENDLRAVETTEKVELTEEEAQTGQWKLIPLV